jgi:hypothetical protein
MLLWWQEWRQKCLDKADAFAQERRAASQPLSIDRNESQVLFLALFSGLLLKFRGG